MCDGSGYGDGYGSGSGYGSGYGDGDGDGYGYGSGSGSGYGYGDGESVSTAYAFCVERLRCDVWRIGCEVHSASEWRSRWREIGLEHQEGREDNCEGLRVALVAAGVLSP